MPVLANLFDCVMNPDGEEFTGTTERQKHCPQIVLMWKMFAPKSRPAVKQPTPSEPPTATEHSDSDEDGSGSDEVDEHEPPNTSSSHRVYCRSEKDGGQGSQYTSASRYRIELV
ncbi:hypothetical protein B0H13DRAFT_1854897 [Mycena leptocephala]|nr:hypothetical protein B0H13DRAFT_1854897 [Mycena leptocephala]